MNLKMNEDRYYAVRLLWVHDPEAFAEYQEMAKPTLARRGVHMERWLMTENIVGSGLEKPDQTVVTWFKNAAAKEAFENDPDYKLAAAIKEKPVNLATITVNSVFGN